MLGDDCMDTFRCWEERYSDRYPLMYDGNNVITVLSIQSIHDMNVQHAMFERPHIVFWSLNT